MLTPIQCQVPDPTTSLTETPFRNPAPHTPAPDAHWTWPLLHSLAASKGSCQQGDRAAIHCTQRGVIHCPPHSVCKELLARRQHSWLLVPFFLQAGSGVYALMLINAAVFVADNLLHLPSISTLALYHAQ